MKDYLKKFTGAAYALGVVSLPLLGAATFSAGMTCGSFYIFACTVSAIVDCYLAYKLYVASQKIKKTE